MISVTINGIPYATELDKDGVQRIVAPGAQPVSDATETRLLLARGQIDVDAAIARDAEGEPSMHLIWERYTWEANVDYFPRAVIHNPLWKNLEEPS